MPPSEATPLLSPNWGPQYNLDLQAQFILYCTGISHLETLTIAPLSNKGVHFICSNPIRCLIIFFGTHHFTNKARFAGVVVDHRVAQVIMLLEAKLFAHPYACLHILSKNIEHIAECFWWCSVQRFYFAICRKISTIGHVSFSLEALSTTWNKRMSISRLRIKLLKASNKEPQKLQNVLTWEKTLI